MDVNKIKLLINSIENSLELLKIELNQTNELVKGELKTSEESNIVKVSLEDLLKRIDYQPDTDIDYYEEPL